MRREWSLTGVGGPSKPRLSSTARGIIADTVKEHRKAHKPPEEFYAFIAKAIGRFDMYVHWAHQSRPAVIRKALADARLAALKLSEALDALDGNARALLDEAVPGGIFTLQGGEHEVLADATYKYLSGGHLRTIIEALFKAEALAGEYAGGGRKKGGALKQHHRAFLAADVAYAVETYLGVRPSKSKSGLFVKVLEAVVADATRKRDATVHQLASRVLSSVVRIELGGGMVEYVPPKT